jgi:hypothetical protein
MTAPVTGDAVTAGCFEWVTHLTVSRYYQLFLKPQSEALFKLSIGKAF